MSNALTFDQFDKLKPFAAKLKKFVRLTKKKRDLDARLKDVKEAIAELVGTGDEPTDLINVFTTNRIQNVPGIDGMTVYLTRKVFAGNAIKEKDDPIGHAKNKKRIFEILRSVGLEAYTDETFSSAALGAYFKEQQDQKEHDLGTIVELEEVVPTDLKGLMNVAEKFTLAGRG